MKKIIQLPLSETGALADALRNGDAVELMDGDERVATVVRRPSGEEQSAREQRIQEIIEAGVLRRAGVISDDQYAARMPPETALAPVPLPSAEDERRLEEHIEKLIREGKIKRYGTGVIPPDFFKELPPKGGTGVLQQLLDDRRSGR